MSTNPDLKCAIVDYGLGNLFSIKHACEYVGIQANITHEKKDILEADAVILPGVGAYGDAMNTLRQHDLESVLQDAAFSGKLLIGICLGIQLLMEGSEEFGTHKGLGIFRGNVTKITGAIEKGYKLKVPQVGWNTIHPPKQGAVSSENRWGGTLLDEVPDDTFMYFVHSFIVKPSDPQCVLSATTYGGIEFCSSIEKNNIFACQYHPERSGVHGLKIYKNIKKRMLSQKRCN